MKKLLIFALALVAGAFSYSSDVRAGTTTTPTLYYGKLVVNITIDVSSAVPSGDSVYCTASFLTSDSGAAGGTGQTTETGVGTATPTGASSGYGGSVYNCTVTIPYEWRLLNGPTDVVIGYYSAGIAPTNVLNTGARDVYRFGSHSLAYQVGMYPNGPNTFSVETRL